MTEQAYNYMAMKPLAERFKDVAKNITDEEIKRLILDTVRDKLNSAIGDAFYVVPEILDDYINEHSYELCEMAMMGIKRRLE